MQGRRWFVAVAVAVALTAAACGGGNGNGDGSGAGTTRPTRPAPPPPQQLVASDGAKNDYFGGDLWYNNFAKPVKATYYATPGEAAMSSDGNVAVVGAPGHSNGAKVGAGAAYVYTRRAGRYTQAAKLVAADAASYDGFGWSVAISGDGHDIMVGAAYDDVGQSADVGSLYFFHQSGATWTQAAEVRPKDVTAYDGFGFSVAISRDGTTAVAGAPAHAVDGRRGQGTAYVFRRSGTTWVETFELRSGGGRAQDDFGAAAALSADGTTIAVTKASHITSDKVLHPGATYVFRSSKPGQPPKQVALFNDTNRNHDKSTDAYGVNAAFSDDGHILAIASPDVNIGKALGAGATYVYTTTSNWSVPARNATTQLLPTEPVSYGYYGSCVAFSSDGRVLWIGVDGVGSNGQGGGDLVRASTATPEGWNASTVTHTVVRAPNTEQGRYGTAVAISADGETLLSTAPWLAVKGREKQGAAYVSSAPGVSAP